MIHEPTQRVKGLLGDACSSCCCIDQNVYVGIDSLPTDSLFLYIAVPVKHQCLEYIAE